MLDGATASGWRTSLNPVAMIVEPTSPVPRRRRRGLAALSSPRRSGGPLGSTDAVGAVGPIRRGEDRRSTGVTERARPAGVPTPTPTADEAGAPRRDALPLVNPLFVSMLATVLFLVGLLVVVLLHPAGP